MKSYFVRRKELDHVPFQFYVDREGRARPLEKGVMSVFTIFPTKNDIAEVYVLVTQGFVRETESRWELAQADMVRVAAKAVEAWLKDEPIPSDHFYGPEMVRVDMSWYPHETDFSPALAANPYGFGVTTDELGPSILDWDPTTTSKDDSQEVGQQRTDTNFPKVIFGYTVDVFPGMLIVGFEQLKHRVSDLGLQVEVRLCPLSDLPADLYVLFVPGALVDAARTAAPGRRVQALEDFVNHPVYDSLIQEFKAGVEPRVPTPVAEAVK